MDLFFFGISNRHSGLVEDTTALEKMYVEGTLAKLPVTSENGELLILLIIIGVAAQNLRGRTV